MHFNAGMRLGALLTLAQLSAGRTLAQDPERRVQPPVVVSFALNGGSNTVARHEPFLLLTHRITGTTPLEYRVGARPDFAGATWRSYTVSLRLNDWLAFERQGASCEGAQVGTRVVLYFQVRSQTGSVLRIIEGRRVLVPQLTESNVVTDSICALTESGSDPTHSA